MFSAAPENLDVTVVPDWLKSSSDHLKCLYAVWSGLHDTVLHVIVIEDGVFAHLGTTKELLSLVTCAKGNVRYGVGADEDVILAASGETFRSEIALDSGRQERLTESIPREGAVHEVDSDFNSTAAPEGEEKSDVAELPFLCKERVFAKKYGLTAVTMSCLDLRGSETSPRGTEAEPGFVTVNSIIAAGRGFPGESKSNSPTVRIGGGSFVEHSALSGGGLCVGSHAVVSHVGGGLGRDLVVLDNVMVQQLLLSERIHGGNGGGGGSAQASSRETLSTVIVLSTVDDIKCAYTVPGEDGK